MINRQLVIAWLVAKSLNVSSQIYPYVCSQISGLVLAPNTTTTPKPFDPPRFVVLGTNDPSQKGLGNIMTFFPTVYWFTVFTKRYIVINDDSLLGQFCQVIRCGFPLVSQIRPAYPDLFKEYNLQHLRIVGARDIKEIFDSRQELHQELPLLTVTGIDSKSEWWMYFRELADCAARVSGCTLGDITCTERHAYQQLVIGPFHNPSAMIPLLTGLSDSHKAGIVNLPFTYMPRFELAFHLRNQFSYFEQPLTGNANAAGNPGPANSPDKPSFSSLHEEAALWLNSSECQSVFIQFESMILDTLNKRRRRPYWKGPPLSPINRPPPEPPLLVYLSGDSSIVKAALKNHLLRTGNGGELALYVKTKLLNIVMIDPDRYEVTHAKHLLGAGSNDKGQSMSIMALDWICLALSDSLLAWRKGSVSHRAASTFVFSASRASGSRSRTTINSDHSNSHTESDRSTSRGMGTEAYQLYAAKGQGGRLVRERIWIHNNVDLK